MRYFSYNDFVDCTENGEIEKITKVNEKIAKYELKNIEKKQVNNTKKILEILKEKIELKKFIEEFFELSEIGNIGNITYENNVHSITDKEIRNNVICKIQNKQIFIFIKVIENIDNNISYKMFEHSLNIIKKWNLEDKMANKRYPIVIPIVIYVGKDTWKINKRNTYKKINYTTCKDNCINFSYNIININDLQLNYLEKMQSKVAKEIKELKNKYLQINQKNID